MRKRTAYIIGDFLKMNFRDSKNQRLTFFPKHAILKSPSSWGVSGALYQQPAIVGVMLCPGFVSVGLPFISGDDVWVLRNGTL